MLEATASRLRANVAEICFPEGRVTSTPELPDLRDLLFVTGAESHPAHPAIIESTPDAEGIRVLPPLNGYVGDMSDPVAPEIERMQAILGPPLPALAGRPGPLRTREDVRAVVSKMRPTGL